MRLNIQKFATLNVGDTYETTPIDIKPYGYNVAHYQMKFTVKLNSQNLSNFTSNITVTSYLRTTGSQWGWSGFNSIYMERYTKVNNEAGYTLRNSTQISKLPTNNANNWVNCGSWTDNIQHLTDGTCTLYVKNYLNTTGASNYNYIPRATTLESESLTLHQLHKAPSLTINSITELNTYLTGVANNVIVQNLSTKRFTFTPTLHDNATISSVTFSNGNTTATGTASPITLDFINKNVAMSGTSATIKAVIKDSYNTTGEVQQTYTAIPYNKPAINSQTTVRRNGQLTGKVLLNLTGTFYNHTVGSVANTITVDYKHWEKGGTEPNSYTQVPNQYVSVSGDNVSVSNYEIGTTDTSASNYFDYQKSYNVKIRIYDAMRRPYASTYTYIADEVTRTIPLGEPTWSEYKDRVDFRKITVQGTNPIEYDTNGTIFSTGTEYLYLSASFQPPNVNATLYLPKRIPDGKTLSMSGNIRLFTGNAMPISTWTDMSNLSPTITYIPNTNIVRIQLVTSITTGNWQDAVLNISNGSTISMSTTT